MSDSKEVEVLKLVANTKELDANSINRGYITFRTDRKVKLGSLYRTTLDFGFELDRQPFSAVGQVFNFDGGHNVDTHSVTIHSINTKEAKISVNRTDSNSAGSAEFYIAIVVYFQI